MSYLLDTHALIWALLDPDLLGRRARAMLLERANPVHVSSVSFWEISLKFTLGKLELSGCQPEDLHDAAIQTGFSLLALETGVAAGFHRLPRQRHRDPFDRMLIWQALQGGHVLVTRDKALSAYAGSGLRTLW